MNSGLSILSKTEQVYAELYAWGLTKKEIAQRLNRSEHTVRTQLQNVFLKAGVKKDTELSAWYFCSRFNISLDLSPLKRSLTAIVLLVLMLTSIESNQVFRIRTARSRTTTSARMTRTRTKRSEYEIEI
jgi:DNA-binding CsgD family transcriptional regulator